jgi:hypothetical protein
VLSATRIMGVDATLFLGANGMLFLRQIFRLVPLTKIMTLRETNVLEVELDTWRDGLKVALAIAPRESVISVKFSR